MEQNATAASAWRSPDRADAAPVPDAERSRETRPARWMKLHQVKGAKEILERTGRLPGVLRFQASQTIYAFRIPKGQSYCVILPDRREILMREGVNELEPPALVQAGGQIRLRFLHSAGAKHQTHRAADSFDAHLDALRSDPSFEPEPLPADSRLAAAHEEELDVLGSGVLEPVEEAAGSPEQDFNAASVVASEPVRVPRLPVLSFGVRGERHPGLLARLFGASHHKEGTR